MNIRRPFGITIYCVLAALTFAARAQAETFWQLTFVYTPDELVLLRAAQMRPLSKEIRTPGLNGAAVRLEQQLEWLDAQGRVLLTTPVTIPLGGHSTMKEGGVFQENDQYVTPQGAFVVRVPGPENAAAVAQVRLSQPAAGAAAAPLPPDPRVPQPFLRPQQTLPLPATPIAAAAPGPISATKVRNTGQDANRFVVAVLCDGYTAADLQSGSFASKANSFLNAMFAITPWVNYVNMVNVYRVDIESVESGADYADAAPAEGGTLKDTYLNAAFWVGGTERCLFLSSGGISRAMAAADDLIGVGVWDEILVFVNSTKYGGCGGSVGVSSINSASDEIQIHEFGHSFAGLADEYDYGNTGTNCTPNSTRNIDCPNNFPTVKWQVWVDPGTPIPTPDTAQYNNVIGAFEGAAYQTLGIYRPWRNCKMRSLGVPFCSVCSETHILRLFRQLRIADSLDPAPGGLTDVPSYSGREFRVTPLGVAGLQYQWFTNGVLMPGATNRSLTINGSQVTTAGFQLRVDARHTSVLVRAEQIVQSNRWTLRPVAEPGIWIGDATIVEGNSGETNLEFTVLHSFAHTTNVTVRFTTVDGTAIAGSDYSPTNGMLTFLPGQLANTIRVRIFGDVMTEADEVLFVRLSDPTNATLARTQASGLIVDRDQPPGLSLTAPLAGAAFSAPANIGLTANAFDTDGFITQVEFFADAVSLGHAFEEPFSLSWSNVLVGNYILNAVATDNSGKLATSAPVNVSVLAGAAQQFKLVELTNSWRYDATTIDYGTAWKDAAYDDSLWEGPSPALLHNEGDTVPGPKNTQIPLAYNSERIRSYYFRTHFDFPADPATGWLLIASNLVDDGAVFWLNGTELGRLRMQPLPTVITRTSLASSQPPGGDATTFDVLTFPGTNLLQGDNVLAVEVHQQATNSSDVVFGMSLDAFASFAPIFTDLSQPTNRTVTQGRPATFIVNVAASPSAALQWYRNGSAISGATNPSYSIISMTAGLAGTYFVRATNIIGVTTSRVAQVTYEADTVPPTLVYALGSTLLTRVTVSFSERMNFADAATLGNYRLTSSTGANLVVSAASVQGAGVILTTAARQPGVSYTLTVNNLRDVAGNSIAPNSSIPVTTEVDLVTGGNSGWRYFQSDQAPALGWAVPGFDDFSLWGTGPALFDAKRPAGRTTVGPASEPVGTMLSLTNPPDAGVQSVAYYFRTAFNLPGPAAGVRLRLRPLVDDGGVFYLNGREIFRLRMPQPPALISYATMATTNQGDSQNVYEGPFDIPSEFLRDGQNILAAEVHQATEDSSDMSFAVQLIGEFPTIGFPQLALSIVHDQDGMSLLWDETGAILEQASDIAGPWTSPEQIATSPYPLTPTNSARFFRLTKE